MTQPIALVTKPTVAEEIKVEVLRILREALAKAEAGDVESCIVILRHPGGSWSDERSGLLKMAEAIGHIEIVKQSWITSYLRES